MDTPIAPVAIIETPFSKRHCCWFCGEPSQVSFIFPAISATSANETKQYLLRSCSHPVISVPTCYECQQLAKNNHEENIWAVKHLVKRQLLKRYAKDLAIGIQWSEQELASSEFEQGNFAGFARSAWFMYEVAKERVNYLGWPLVVHGIELNEDELVAADTFSFDGVLYPSLAEAINHYAKVFLLDEPYVMAVLQYMSHGDIDEKSFAQAVRFCRLLVNATANERKVAFKALMNNSG
ncbi:hypothetical protein CMT41_06115 [Colwellia sp. MT41]|uniref:DUF2225 domain-containing protein n=1 Tax=Colwellia marinimaniae TaxID=1513592 RepID=A0ABQ0MZD6_9GAMM|nr:MULTISPECIES: hypothetical protein [Colwellia]ALO34354.1 hypothetical protein CMT41_06115 [Colwellia sp. MT41]GAW97733.1 hypothetical protein MTCD1_03376 [Colwellia marinimaniae]